MKRRTPLRRKTQMRRRPPTRRPSAPGKKPKPVPRPHHLSEFWQGQRNALLLRSGCRCERCGSNLNTTGMEAHHRKLRSQGGGHGLENLLALCPDCHRWCHENRGAARRHGWIVHPTSDPAARAVLLHDGRTVRFTRDGNYDVVFDDTEEEAG